jgi:hypothetical protein
MNGYLIDLVVVFLVIAVSTVGLYLLGRALRNSAQGSLKQLGTDFRRFQEAMRELSLTIQEFDEIDREPFISRLSLLQDRFDAFHKAYRKAQEGYIQIRERIRRASSNPWNRTLGAPIFWQSVRGDIARLNEQIPGLESLQKEAQETETSLKQLGWELAQQAREVRNLDQRVLTILMRLASRNVHGEIFDDALGSQSQIRETINQIPAFFLTGDKETVLNQAEEHNITLTYRLLSSIRPELESLLQKAQSWEKSYLDATRSVNRMRRILSSVENSLAGAPEILNLTTFTKHLQGLNIISQNLYATLSRLEVESMPAVIEEAERVQRNAIDMEVIIRQAHQQVNELIPALNELNEEMKKLSLLVADLSARERLPIDWEQSRPALSELSQKINVIKAAGEIRTVEEVGQDLTTVNRLNEDITKLAAHCQSIADQHAELLGILENPDIQHAGEWLEKAKIVAQKAVLYSVENWEQSDAVLSLPDDLAMFEMQLQGVLQNREDPISESQVGKQLEKTKKVKEWYFVLRQRISNVATRLEEIQYIESLSQEKLKRSEAGLTQITYLVNSNTFLQRIASRQLSKLDDEFSRLSVAFSQRERGSIEKKARKVDQLATKMETTAVKWLEQLTEELAKQTGELSASLQRLDDIARLDEKAIYEARKLLSSAIIYSSTPASKGTLTLGDTIQQLKERSDYWQEISAVQRGVKDVETPVIDSYEYARQNRDDAQEQYSDLVNWLQETEDWPATRVSLEREKLELDSLNAQWKTTQGSTIKAINLVQKLSKLGGRYLTLAEKIYQAGERVADEQSQVEELESEMAEYEDGWLDVMREYSDEQGVEKEIDRLLKDTNREYERIKSDYRRGTKDYDQVIDALRSLVRRLRMAQVSLADGERVDVDGRVIG